MKTANIEAITTDVTANYARRYAERHIPGKNPWIADTLDAEIDRQIKNHERTEKMNQRAAARKSAAEAAARLRENCPVCTAKRAAQERNDANELSRLEGEYPLVVVSHEEFKCSVCGEVYFVPDIN